jgi:hypothetical protein
MSEIKLYEKPEMSYPITANVTVKDIYGNTKIKKLSRDIIIASKCFPKIKERKNEVQVEFEGELREPRQIEITQHINKSILDAGLTNTWESEDVQYLIASVLTDVLTDFPHLTTQEVGIAFKRGSREEYGKNYGISTRAYYSWLRTYCNETKLQANKDLLRIDVKKEVEPSEEEKKKIEEAWLKGVYEAYDKFIETELYGFYDLDNMLYNLLKKEGLIVFSEQKRKEIWKEAKEQLKYRKNPLEVKNEFHRQEILKFIGMIKNNDKSVQQKVISQAKHIGLKIYLTNLSKKKKSLKEIIEKKLAEK